MSIDDLRKAVRGQSLDYKSTVVQLVLLKLLSTLVDVSTSSTPLTCLVAHLYDYEWLPTGPS